eukprot:TRINITY_DN10289_c0_g2_i1.p1 TRINITY_DN10289_c0_g2~~TRINITY_DN10289_c0_g2_i1.p1  ORF type:complete len:304 (-),score=44.09 TRINITY_DN10289_c0_g2_i1:293-1204(-)
MSTGVKKWQKLALYLQQLSASPRFWRVVMVALASVGGSVYTFVKLRDYWLHKQSSNQHQIRLQDLPSDIDRLKSICLEKLQENQALVESISNRDRELSTQRQSLANLALTVVKQDRHIKALLAHMDMQPMELLQECHNQLNHELNNVTNSYIPDKASVSGISGGLTESGIFDNFDDVHDPSVHLWSLPHGDNIYASHELSIGEEDNDEVSQLKMQIMEANDFLNDLATDEEMVVSRTSSLGTNLSSSVSNLSRPLRKKPYQPYQRWSSMPTRNVSKYNRATLKHTVSALNEFDQNSQNASNQI